MTDFQNDYQRNLIATVVHELKTPIAAVRGFVELVQQAGPLNATQTQYVQRAMNGLQRMELLIASLLETARLESDLTLTISRADLHQMIHESAEMIHGIAQKRGIQIEVMLADDARFVMGDADLLSLVISNLVSNAVKYNRDGGSVYVSIRAQAEQLQVDVRDTGMGIPPDDLKRVFEPFTRLQTGERIEGSGLGLWIAQRIVEKHEGRLWVESTPGEGSTFSFTLPNKVKDQPET